MTLNFHLIMQKNIKKDNDNNNNKYYANVMGTNYNHKSNYNNNNNNTFRKLYGKKYDILKKSKSINRIMMMLKLWNQKSSENHLNQWIIK